MYNIRYICSFNLYGVILILVFSSFFLLIHIHIIMSFGCWGAWLIDLDIRMWQTHQGCIVIAARIDAHLAAGRGSGWRLLRRLMEQTRVVVAVGRLGGGICCWPTTDIEQPGMAKNILQVDPILGSHPQARLDQIAAGVRQTAAEVESSQHNLLVLLEGDVALDHVEEKDAEGPDGSRATQVALAGDPLGRCVHTGSWKMKIIRNRSSRTR